MAGEIDRRIESKVITKCDICSKVPSENAILVLEAFPTSKQNQLPCKSTYNLCDLTNQYLQPRLLKMDFNYNEIFSSILSKVEPDAYFQNSIFDLHPEHKLLLIRSIIDTFIFLKATQIARKVTLDIQFQKMSKRKKNANVVKHFKGR